MLVQEAREFEESEEDLKANKIVKSLFTLAFRLLQEAKKEEKKNARIKRGIRRSCL